MELLGIPQVQLKQGFKKKNSNDSYKFAYLFLNPLFRLEFFFFWSINGLCPIKREMSFALYVDLNNTMTWARRFWMAPSRRKFGANYYNTWRLISEWLAPYCRNTGASGVTYYWNTLSTSNREPTRCWTQSRRQPPSSRSSGSACPKVQWMD